MTTMLDAITQAQIWQVVIKYCKENNIGLIVISHDKNLVDRICDRVINLDNDVKNNDLLEIKENIIQVKYTKILIIINNLNFMIIKSIFVL